MMRLGGVIDVLLPKTLTISPGFRVDGYERLGPLDYRVFLNVGWAQQPILSLSKRS